MPVDGSPNPTATYVELSNADHMPVASIPYRVQQDGDTLYSHLSPLQQFTFGRKTPNDKFTEVIVEGETVYTESHVTRMPNED